MIFSRTGVDSTGSVETSSVEDANPASRSRAADLSDRPAAPAWERLLTDPGRCDVDFRANLAPKLAHAQAAILAQFDCDTGLPFSRTATIYTETDITPSTRNRLLTVQPLKCR